MEATTVGGETCSHAAINEVWLLRETRQTAKIEIKVNGRVVKPDWVRRRFGGNPAGSTAYNLSAHGPILPLKADMLALTPISPFRPRRWRGAILPDDISVSLKVREAEKRPVVAVADQKEVRDVATCRCQTGSRTFAHFAVRSRARAGRTDRDGTVRPSLTSGGLPVSRAPARYLGARRFPIQGRAAPR